MYIVDEGVEVAGSRVGEPGRIFRLLDAAGTLRLVRTTAPILGPTGIAVDPATQDLLVFDRSQGRLVRVTPQTHAVSDVLAGFSTAGFNYANVDLSPDGDRIFVTGRSAHGGRVYTFARVDQIADCDGNGIDDTNDIEEARALDCNDNGAPDSCDVSTGESDDCNGNGIPDECEASGTSRVWRRLVDWSPGSDPVSTAGSSAAEVDISAVWRYECVRSEPTAPAQFCYEQPTALMTWDSRHGMPGRWTRRAHENPTVSRHVAEHVITPDAWPFAPLIRWIYQGNSGMAVHIIGELVIYWSGRDRIGSPVPVDVVLASMMRQRVK